MPKITALHISDLHWSAAEHKNLKIVIDALVADLAELRAQGIKPDVVVWTGDLVQSGEDGDAFLAADETFFEPILAAAKLDRDRLFVVPGNHDISRKYVRETGYVEKGLKATLQTVDQVNAFIDGPAGGKSDPAKTALGRMDNFSAYMGAAAGRKPTFENLWLNTHTLDIEGVSIGVACFNTAWRATGEHENADRHELLMGERNVDLAIEALKETKVRFALFHHPLDWLADFDMSAVAARLYAQFDVLFYGHTHQTHPELRSGPTGTAILSQTGSVYQRRKYFNGYQLVEIDTDSNEVVFHVRTYFDHPRRAFDAATNVVPGGKSVFAYKTRCDSAAFAHIEKVLREVRPVVRQSAADHLNIVKAIDDLRLEPREAFICPPITWNRSVTTDNQGHIQNSLNADAILRSEDNFLIFGERESGKSSLAHYMAVLAAEGLVDRPRIPVVLSLPELARHTHGLRKAVGAYIGATKTGLDIDASMQAGDFIFFVDGVDIADTNVRQRLQELIERTDGCRWILLANYRFGEAETDGLENAVNVPFKSAHIHRLPRKAIRELARRWTQQSGGDDERTFATVMQHLESSSLPRTGYIVTLLLWAVHQGRSFERLNEAVLLTALVDHLLGKTDFTQALRREFDAASKEITLQSLAVYLREKGGAVETAEAASFVSSFFKERGLPHDGVAVLDALVECGILQARDGWVSFKYRCFLEYFFALKLRADGTLLHQHLQGTAFLNVERELDLLSGLRRENEEIIAAISNAVSTMAPPEIDNAKPENFEEIAAGDAATGLSRSKLEDIRKKKLTPDDIDDLVDAAEAKIAKRKPRKLDGPNGGQSDAMEPEAIDGRMNVAQYLNSSNLLGRVVRNSEFDKREDKLAATRLYLDTVNRSFIVFCTVISDLIERVLENKEAKGKLTEADFRGIQYVLAKILFGIFVDASNRSLASEKLIPIYAELLAGETNTSARILLCGLMLELGAPGWDDDWERLIEDSEKKRFVLDFLLDRLWGLIHARPLSDADRTRVEALATQIERKFLPGFSNATLINSIRESARSTQRRDKADED